MNAILPWDDIDKLRVRVNDATPKSEKHSPFPGCTFGPPLGSTFQNPSELLNSRFTVADSHHEFALSR